MRITRTLCAVLVGAGAACAGQPQQQPQVSAPGVRAPVVLAAGEGRRLELGTGEVTILSRSADTEGRLSQIVLAERPGYETPLHIHRDMDEAFYVLEGRLTVRIEDRLVQLDPGASLIIPRGTRHAQANHGTGVVRVLLSFSPAGFETFFEERAVLVGDHPPGSPEYGPRMRALSERHQMENVDFEPFRAAPPP